MKNFNAYRVQVRMEDQAQNQSKLKNLSDEYKASLNQRMYVKRAKSQMIKVMREQQSQNAIASI